MDLEELLEIGIQVTDALEAVHSEGIIRRDIKPIFGELVPGCIMGPTFWTGGT